MEDRLSELPLHLALLELASEFMTQGNKLILAGGYGLYVKQFQMQMASERTDAGKLEGYVGAVKTALPQRWSAQVLFVRGRRIVGKYCP